MACYGRALPSLRYELGPPRTFLLVTVGNDSEYGVTQQKAVKETFHVLTPEFIS
jgi:hypothetical protein